MGAQAIAILWGKPRHSLLSLKGWDHQRPGVAEDVPGLPGGRAALWDQSEVSCLGLWCYKAEHL